MADRYHFEGGPLRKIEVTPYYADDRLPTHIITPFRRNFKTVTMLCAGGSSGADHGLMMRHPKRTRYRTIHLTLVSCSLA